MRPRTEVGMEAGHTFRCPHRHAKPMYIRGACSVLRVRQARVMIHLIALGLDVGLGCWLLLLQTLCCMGMAAPQAQFESTISHITVTTRYFHNFGGIVARGTTPWFPSTSPMCLV